VADAGVVNWGAEQGEYLEVDDPRALRRHLELKLVANAELRALLATRRAHRVELHLQRRARGGVYERLHRLCRQRRE
jgi:hypothetical protein